MTHSPRQITRRVAALIWLACLSGVTLNAIALPSRADAIAPDPWTLVHVARSHGTADVGRDAMQDPQIHASHQGRAYALSFYGCYLGRSCTTLLFESRIDAPEDADIEALAAEWNSTRLIGRAFKDRDERLGLDHAVALGGPAPRTVVEATFTAWLTALEDFAQHIDFKEEKQ